MVCVGAEQKFVGVHQEGQFTLSACLKSLGRIYLI